MNARMHDMHFAQITDIQNVENGKNSPGVAAPAK
jgi:hypothetical protein